MKTEAKFAIKIKELMQTTPLDQISVKNLCDTVGVNRQTFYYHFRDIYDLLTAIFLNEKIEGLSKTTGRILKGYYYGKGGKIMKSQALKDKEK